MNYFRIQVSLAHMGTASTEYRQWHIATSLSASDVMSNRGHVLPGVRRVTEVRAITQTEYEAARRRGRSAFSVEARKGQG